MLYDHVLRTGVAVLEGRSWKFENINEAYLAGLSFSMLREARHDI